MKATSRFFRTIIWSWVPSIWWRGREPEWWTTRICRGLWLELYSRAHWWSCPGASGGAVGSKQKIYLDALAGLHWRGFGWIISKLLEEKKIGVDDGAWSFGHFDEVERQRIAALCVWECPKEMFHVGCFQKWRHGHLLITFKILYSSNAVIDL